MRKTSFLTFWGLREKLECPPVGVAGETKGTIIAAGCALCTTCPSGGGPVLFLIQ